MIHVRSTRVFFFLLLFPLLAIAEHLPITIYTTREGLPHNRIKWVFQDRQGFLWFGTPDGLSRFDGSDFLTIQAGLSHPVVNFAFQSSDGNHWIATNGGGVCKFDPSSVQAYGSAQPASFKKYVVGKTEISNRVNFLLEDSGHRIWAGSDEGLFRYDSKQDAAGFQPVEIGLLHDHSEQQAITTMIQDRQNAVWIGTGGSGLYRIHPGGTVDRFSSEHGFPTYPIYTWALKEDRNGIIWVGTSDGLYRLVNQPKGNQPIVSRAYENANGLEFYVRALNESPDGKLWIGTNNGLVLFDGMHFTKYTTSHGLSHDEITAITFDGEGHAWIGTSIGGVNKIAQHGFTTYRKEDGLDNPHVQSFAENESGDLYALSSNWMIHRFDGTRFVAARPTLPSRMINPGWWWLRNALLSDSGNWWIATKDGLFRYSATTNFEELARMKPDRVYTVSDGLASDNVQTIFEDSRGNLWISTTTAGRTGLSRLDRSTDKFEHYSSADGLPAANWPTAFAEDRKGAVWIGFYYGGLAKYSSGRFRFFDESSGIARGSIRELFVDRSGRLWIATEHSGARCIRNPDSEPWKIDSYTQELGLSSNSVWCFTEDNSGRIYVGTARGLDCLDLKRQSIRNFSVSDGLADQFVQTAFRDQSGKLWFGTPKGISRLAPELRMELSVPRVFISSLKVAGVPYRVSLSGEAQISNLRLEPQQNDLEISSTSLSFHGPDQVRFRYRLIGAEEKWSSWSDQKNVYYASLQPGQYTFEAQARNAEGAISPTPARISFTILSPYWKRPWFLLLLAGLALTLIYASYRYRILQLLRLERVRTQIASDLHDDIGLSLSHIAVLSEVIRKKAATNGADLSDSLLQIGRISREAVDSMSDIVWAVNPHKDRMMDLERRMHHAANEILFVRDIRFSFQTRGYKEDQIVPTNVRREVLMVFKESLNNIVRHSGCSNVQIQFSLNKRVLDLVVTDDGKGFPASTNAEGNGLINMRKRAKNAGGTLEIKSISGDGTTIHLRVPLH